MATIRHRSVRLGDVEVFYREAGDPDAPVLLLLHGFPTSSHQFVRLMRRLAGRWRLIAPDLPGFGRTVTPDGFTFTFDRLAEVLGEFTEALELRRYALYVFDFGAPAGLRLAVSRPSEVTALITQNGNAYVEGLGPAMPDFANLTDEAEAKRGFAEILGLEQIKWQYTEGARDPETIDPSNYLLDRYFLDSPGREVAMQDLLWDYRNNPPVYPKFQAWLRETQPPVLAVWGRNDQFFVPAGAEAFRKDVPSAEVHFFDTGHFALEEDVEPISELIDRFLAAQH
ncbi:alpha/beta fold hydrolase [Amycolatopsis umgeniensis]|uniref:Pimeloyl-ACP methyl ester carboxylesterase n=1 Tax=Amycolatopsis umgeniensis TaxID=336628 RepID=A0A841BCN1_9PSEU|nr:alpha/beta hydrolase [Amycolatopsis umgeniensis]MBB5856583.1 pimeloyl-ACP methyl ester carboxylesterase [Amycolatopsis umgeniensis]